MASFAPLQPLTEDIFLYEPQHTILDKSPNHPSLVILCTWLGGATARRINKYIAQYRQLFPQSSILLLTTKLIEFTLHRSSVIQARLTLARNAIRRVLASTPISEDAPKDQVLLHMFSNGGCSTAIQLALSMKIPNAVDCAALEEPLPLGGIILDCCPGETDFRRNYQAAVHSLPSSSAPVHLASQALLYPAIAAGTGLQHVGLMRSVEDLRTQLNDGAVFGNVPRLYLYSGTDQTVPSRCVRSHAKEAREKGYLVDEVMFSKGVHCALVLEDGDLYWGAIESFWKRSVAARGAERESKL